MSTLATIAESLTKIYDFFLAIGYIDEDNYVRQPDIRHPLPVAACQKQGIDETAIAFLRMIPVALLEVDLVHESPSFAWLDENQVKGSRIPTFPDAAFHGMDDIFAHLPSHMVPLTTCTPDEGSALVVDTKACGTLSLQRLRELTSYRYHCPLVSS
jgi:hypothetical protein